MATTSTSQRNPPLRRCGLFRATHRVAIPDAMHYDAFFRRAIHIISFCVGARKQRSFRPKTFHIREMRRLDAAQTSAYAIAAHRFSAREAHRLARNNSSAIAKAFGAYRGPRTRQEHFKSADAVDAGRAARGQQAQRATLNARKAHAHDEQQPPR